MDVIELRNPNALRLPALQGLLKRAVESEALLSPDGFDVLAEDIFNFVIRTDQFMLVGSEKGEFRSLVLGYEPGSRMFPYPSVIMFYNEGSRALLRATKTKLLDILVAKGYTKMLGINGSKRHDGAWLRLLTPKGATSRIVGSMAIFEVE